MVAVQFRSDIQPAALLAKADQSLRAAGWQQVQDLASPLGPGRKWSRRVDGPAEATAILAPGTSGAGTDKYWQLTATAPPSGRRSSGC